MRSQPTGSEPDRLMELEMFAADVPSADGGDIAEWAAEEIRRLRAELGRRTDPRSRMVDRRRALVEQEHDYGHLSPIGVSVGGHLTDWSELEARYGTVADREQAREETR